MEGNPLHIDKLCSRLISSVRKYLQVCVCVCVYVCVCVCVVLCFVVVFKKAVLLKTKCQSAKLSPGSGQHLKIQFRTFSLR